MDPWVGKILWRRKWQPIPVSLPGKSHGQRSQAGYSPWGHKEAGKIEGLTLSHFLSTPLYTVSKNKTRSRLWLRSRTPYCQIQTLKLKKVGKTTRPLRCDLNQIPYNYTVEVTNRSIGLDLIDRVPEELWMEFCDIVQEAVIKTILKKKKCKKGKMVV